MHTKRNAFTLVELLVVIAIITILAGLLLPALQTAIFQARLVSCANRLKQITTATMVYTGDFGDYYPSVGLAQNDPGVGGTQVSKWGRNVPYDLAYCDVVGRLGHEGLERRVDGLLAPVFDGDYDQVYRIFSCPLAQEGATVHIKSTCVNYSYFPVVNVSWDNNRGNMMMRVGQSFTLKAASASRPGSGNSDVPKKSRILVMDNLRTSPSVDGIPALGDPFRKNIAANHFSPGNPVVRNKGNFHLDLIWAGLAGSSSNIALDDGSVRLYQTGYPDPVDLYLRVFDNYWVNRVNKELYIPKELCK